jgi:hypothetical protein
MNPVQWLLLERWIELRVNVAVRACSTCVEECRQDSSMLKDACWATGTAAVTGWQLVSDSSDTPAWCSLTCGVHDEVDGDWCVVGVSYGGARG